MTWQPSLFPTVEHADWIAPYDCADGTKKGSVRPGWRCPACGVVEPNKFLLQNNHWVDADNPNETRWHYECCAMWLRANHARSREAN